MRVLELIGPAVGGIRSHVDELSAWLRRHEVEPVLAGPVGESWLVPDVEVDVSARHGLRGSWESLRRLRDAQVDLVHAHGLTAGWTAVLGRTGRPLVLTVHNVVLGGSPRGRIERVLQWALYRRCDAVIAPSPAIAADVRAALGPRRSRRVDTIVPVFAPPVVRRRRAEVRREWSADGADSLLVVVPARLHPQKDHATLLHAVRIACAADVGLRGRLRVVLAGDGPSRATIDRLVAAQDLSDVVVMAGHRHDLADLVAAADLVALSPVWEAVPLAVVEAMLLGRPVVCTAVGIVEELAPCVRVVPVGAVDALADALAQLLGDPERREALGRSGRELAEERFDVDALASAVLAVYRGVRP